MADDAKPGMWDAANDQAAQGAMWGARKRSDEALAAIRAREAGAGRPTIGDSVRGVANTFTPQAAMGGPGPVDEGMAQAPEPSDPYGDTATGGMGYEGALRQAEMMDGSRRTVRRENPMFEATNQLNNEERRLGIERMDNAQEASATQVSMARDAAVLANEAHEAQAQMALREQFMASQQARRRDEVEQNVAKYATAADKAAAEFAKVEEFDPGAAWANKSVGRKIRIMLAGFGRGLSGGNPADVLRESLQMELDAHKQVRSDANDRLTAVRGSMSNAQQTMQTFLAMTGDERVADALVEKKTLLGIQAKMRAMEAEYGPKILTDQWRAADTALQQQMAVTDYKIAEREKNNPRYFTRKVNTMGSEEQRVRRKMGDQMIDTAGDAVKQGLGSQAAREKFQAENGRDEFGLNKEDRAMVMDYGKDGKVTQAEGVIRQIDAVLALDDIPGIQATGRTIIGSEQYDLDNMAGGVVEGFGRMQSDGVISPDENKTFQEMLFRGVGPGSIFRGESSETRFRKNLKAIKKILEPRIETKRRSLSPAAEKYLTRGEATEFVSEHHDAGHGRKRVQAEDGSITTVDKGKWE
jgi:hypothetical protein